MATGDFQPIQKQLIRCQELLDEARMNGWSDEQKEHLLEASRNLHELAVLWAHASGEPESQPVEATEAPLNRLIHVEPEAQEEEEDNQIDLISSIGEMSLAEKLALQPLAHVADGLSIVERAQFTSVLFSGDEMTFSKLLERLQRASTQEEALAIFHESLEIKDPTDESKALEEEFAKRIVRTFVT